VNIEDGLILCKRVLSLNHQWMLLNIIKSFQ